MLLLFTELTFNAEISLQIKISPAWREECGRGRHLGEDPPHYCLRGSLGFSARNQDQN